MIAQRLRLGFFGSPEQSVGALRALTTANHEVVCVITQPDRPVGRLKAPQPTPVKKAAQELGIQVMAPRSLRRPEVQRDLAMLHADAFVVEHCHARSTRSR